MQHFTTHELEWVETYMSSNFPNDLPAGKITHIHLHSDNATQHFKSTGAINYFTSLIHDRGGPNNCSYVWSFGASGHGKGTFDGIGGVLKNTIHGLIKGTKGSNQGIDGTESGYITTPKDVCDALKSRFEMDKVQNRRRKGGKHSIDYYNIRYFGATENPVRRPDNEEFEHLEKISEVHSRQRSCWCTKCFAALVSGSAQWSATEHCIYECTSSSNRSSTMYSFNKRSCAKVRGVDAQRAIATAQKASRNEMASKLTVGSWVLFKSPDNDEQPIWLGRTVGRADWNDTCILKNNTTRAKVIDGAAIPGKTYAINVQWYTQKVIGVLEYVIEGGDSAIPVVQSNSSLLVVAHDEHMTRVLGNNVRVPRRRAVRTNQSDDFEQQDRICKQVKENGTEENMLMHIEWINLSMILQWISGCIGENRLARHCP